MSSFYDIFISYGRLDSKAFVVKLYKRLTAAGYRVWYDIGNIPLAVDFQNQIDSGIEKSHNFIFVISPHSVNSKFCAKEIDVALRCQKRIVPLLHVEHIDRNTWQQRHPKGTDEQWHAYQSKGLDTICPNMHPEISKINWVYMRDGQDDFERSVAGLEQIFHRHQDYVEQHTQLLNEALAWERKQKQKECLLLGETRQLAEQWLKQRLKSEQPPCIPTDLHCEFITESTKNAHDNMTQVFLTYAQADTGIMNKIRRSLRRQGFTVWNNQTDVSTDETFKQAVSRGIEETDTLVYLLSPASLECHYCRYEVNYALTLKKRIIPVLVRPPAAMPTELSSLQPIDLIDSINAKDDLSDEDELIKALNQDAVYHGKHKALLVKALKWRRQQQNPSVLLRGYALRQAKAWFKTAKKRKLHPPTAYHQEFIQASFQHPPPASIDVFIAYSRADADIARKLNSVLQSQGKTTWFDQESIAVGTRDFQQEIYEGIAASDNILFILSPRSVKSSYYKAEVEYAANLNKRFITILHRPIDPADLHPQLAKVQWLDFSQKRGDFTTHFNHLIRTLDTDRDYVQSHTKWLQRSLEWQQRNNSDDLLLRGMESEIATQWLQSSQQRKRSPMVTPGQIAFITASQKRLEAKVRDERRQMLLFQALSVGLGIVAMVAIGASVFAFQQKSKLDVDAQAARISRSLITHPVEGLARSLRLVSKCQFCLSNLRLSARSTLRDAIGVTLEKNQLNGHTDAIRSVAYSPDGKIIASGGFDQIVRLWDLAGNPIGEPFKGHTDEIWSIAFSPDGQTIATASSDETIRLWDLAGNLIGEPFKGHQGHVKTVAFSPDGTKIVSGDQSGSIRLWNRQGELLIPPLQVSQEDIVWSVAFSPDGTEIISGGENGLVDIWSLQGTRLNSLVDHKGMITSVAVSPDGQRIASGGEDKVIRLWDRQGNLLYRLEGHTDQVMSLAFSADSQWLISGSNDNTVRVWNRDGQAAGPPLIGHEYYVYSVAVSPDGKTILSGSEDTTLRLWKLQDALARKPLYGHNSAVNEIALGGQVLATASDDATVRLWTVDGTAITAPFRGHRDKVLTVDISQDGQLVVSGSEDKTVKLWDRQTNEIATLSGHEGRVNAVAIHPTQPLIASGSKDKTIRLWDSQTKQIIQTITGHEDEVTTVVFSPDGQLLVSASEDRTIRFWDLQGNSISEPLQAHMDDINAIAFSPDGEMFVSASRDQTLRLWKRDGTPVGEPFYGHLSNVVGVAWSPDGRFIVSASRDQTLQLWDLKGNPIGKPLRGHDATVNTVQFSADGQWIISGDEDGKLRFWEGGGPEDWVQWGCDRIREHSILQTADGAGVKEICRFER